MLQSFETYLQKAKSVQTIEQLNQLFQDSTAALGLDRMILCLHPGYAGLDSKDCMGTVCTFPKDWLDYYQERKFYQDDAGTAYRRYARGPFYWSEIEKHMNLTARQEECIQSTVDAGMHAGIAIPLHSIYGIGHIGLASSDKAHTDRDSRQIFPLLSAYCGHYYDTYSQMVIPQNDLEIENISLSPRQIEIIRLIMKGKTDNDVADILGISDNTVDTHLRSIFRKLSVNSRVAMTAKVMSLRLIDY